MEINWAIAGTMLFGAALALVGSLGANLIVELYVESRQKTHAKRRLKTQMAGLTDSIRRLCRPGHTETQFFHLSLNSVREWLAALLHDRASFSHFKDPNFERRLLDWHEAIGMLIVTSDGIDGGSDSWAREGKDPTERVVAFREGLFERLAAAAATGDTLLAELEEQ